MDIVGFISTGIVGAVICFIVGVHIANILLRNSMEGLGVVIPILLSGAISAIVFVFIYLWVLI